MRILKLLLDKIFIPLLILFLTPIIIGIGSKITTNNWIDWFNIVPNVVWIILGALLFIWICSTLIYRRIRRLKKSKHSIGVTILTTPLYGWVNVGKLNYIGVIWRFHTPAPSPYDPFERKEILPNDIEVDGLPRCPHCETELEQHESFWGGYIWSCANCNFKKRNKNSFYEEEKRALKIERRQWELKE